MRSVGDGRALTTSRAKHRGRVSERRGERMAVKRSLDLIHREREGEGRGSESRRMKFHRGNSIKSNIPKGRIPREKAVARADG